jgi:hypothetical protein
MKTKIRLQSVFICGLISQQWSNLSLSHARA